MRIEINLPEVTAELIKNKAKKMNHSRKSFIEYLCKREIEDGALSTEYKPMLECLQPDVLKRPCYKEFHDCKTCVYLKK